MFSINVHLTAHFGSAWFFLHYQMLISSVSHGFVSVSFEGNVMGLILHKQTTETNTVEEDTYDHLCVFFSWKQAGIGAA